jgi:hypothetical protein
MLETSTAAQLGDAKEQSTVDLSADSLAASRDAASVFQKAVKSAAG